MTKETYKESLDSKINKAIDNLQNQFQQATDIGKFLESKSYASFNGAVEKLFNRYPDSEKKDQYRLRFESIIDKAEESAYKTQVEAGKKSLTKKRLSEENQSSEKYLNNRGGGKGKIIPQERRGRIRMYEKINENDPYHYKLL